MAVIKLVEDYSVRQLRNDVRDSLILAGEQAVLLSLYHAGDPDAVPCAECGDDLYESAEKGCTSCYGTYFEGGVRTAMKVWTLFTDHVANERIDSKGVYQNDQRSFQFEAFPLVTERDVVVRVPTWAGDVPTKVEGYYLLSQVTRRSLRTGSRAGQYNWDIVGQKAQVGELPQSLREGITRYPILGQHFDESIQLRQQTPTLPASAVIEPDVKVVYFPFSEGVGGPVVNQPSTGGETQGFTYVQSIPASTWTIQHTLGYEPNVSIIANGEEVDAEVEFPNNSVVVIQFGIPVAGQARLT